MGKYMDKLVNSAIDQAWSSLKASMSELHTQQTGTNDESECDDEGVEGEDDEEELVPVAPNIWDPFMKKWVTKFVGGCRLDGQIMARYMGLRSQEFFYEVKYTDGSYEHLTREEVIRLARRYQTHANSRT